MAEESIKATGKKKFQYFKFERALQKKLENLVSPSFRNLFIFYANRDNLRDLLYSQEGKCDCADCFIFS